MKPRRQVLSRRGPHNTLYISATRSVNGISVFTIPNVRREHGGMYTCIAQNPAGEAESYAMVIVKGKQPFVY